MIFQQHVGLRRCAANPTYIQVGRIRCECNEHRNPTPPVNQRNDLCNIEELISKAAATFLLW